MSGKTHVSQQSYDSSETEKKRQKINGENSTISHKFVVVKQFVGKDFSFFEMPRIIVYAVILWNQAMTSEI